MDPKPVLDYCLVTKGAHALVQLSPGRSLICLPPASVNCSPGGETIPYLSGRANQQLRVSYGVQHAAYAQKKVLRKSGINRLWFNFLPRKTLHQCYGEMTSINQTRLNESSALIPRF
ncbi:predicted protein [Histoplasma capsulatum H143]|uniref:Uncharacterized protein n=1 Tax=Ajellomyces capsulatus (strain H143) TaxID=544712 RepID=C6HFT9_AJECH|nr:predicted protein [Histoplasma capsulatum H143]